MNADFSQFIMDQTDRNHSLEDVLQDMKELPAMSAFTQSASTDSHIRQNLQKALCDAGPSHLTTHIVGLVSDGLSTDQMHNAFPNISVRTIERARDLPMSCNELLLDKYPSKVERCRTSDKELEWIHQFFRDVCTPAAPNQNGATVELHRGDELSRVSKLFQNETDSSIYTLYALEWIGTHPTPPRSKAFLIAHRYFILLNTKGAALTYSVGPRRCGIVHLRAQRRLITARNALALLSCRRKVFWTKASKWSLTRSLHMLNMSAINGRHFFINFDHYHRARYYAILYNTLSK